MSKVKEAFDILFVLLTSVYLLYTLTVSPENFKWALIYTSMVLLYFVALILSKFYPSVIDVKTYGKKSIFPFNIMVLISFAVFFFMIIRAGTLGYSIVDAPVFSALGTGPEFEPLRSGIAGIIENRFFFCFLFFTILASLMIFFQKEFALPLAILINSFIFTAYHFLVYGSQSTAILKVFIFGLISSVAIYFTRFPLLIDAIHAGSNIGVTWARISDVSIFIYLQTLLPWIVGLVILYLLWKRFR
ncbi:MAG: hypothetical protein ACTSUF_09630 [Candidatus Heimdallarchaeaceae archaeon]